MLTGLVFLFVGSVLFLNGIWIMGHIEDREISVVNVFVGTLTLLVAVYLAFGPQADADSIKTAAFTLLFTFTYYWVAWNRWNGADGRGLGWFCFFVGVTAIQPCRPLPMLLAPWATGWQCAGLPGRCCGSCSGRCWLCKSRLRE